MNLLLRKARQNAGLTQRDVSKVFGYTSSQYVSNWERSMSIPPPKDLKKLSKIYGCDLNELKSNYLVTAIDMATNRIKARLERVK